MRNGVVRLKQGALALLLACGMGLAGAKPPEAIQFVDKHTIENCLLPAAAERGMPEYPKRAMAENRSAKVLAQLVFSAPDAPPETLITSDSTDKEFEQVVRKFLSRYRMPCLKTGEAGVATKQEFVFAASDSRVAATEDIESTYFRAHRECLRTVVPAYPVPSARRGAQGNVIVDITFMQRGQAPKVRVVYDGDDKWLEEAAVGAAKAYRYECDIPFADGLTGRQVFQFLLEDSERARFNDTDIRTLLGMVEKSSWAKAKFDTSTMGCPFDLRVYAYQPFDKNWVDELDKENLARKPFLDWVANMAFNIPKRLQPLVTGDSFVVHVPCVDIDLTQEAAR